MAPLVARLQRDRFFRVKTAVSAQHRQMLDQVLRAFSLKADADLNLMTPGQSLFDITAKALVSFRPVLERLKPDLVLVHGDTTTTLAGALAAFYRRIPVGHVEAGLRSYNLAQPFPEELNRRITDTVAALAFAPTPSSADQLKREGHPGQTIFVTGNTVIDALKSMVRLNPPVSNSTLKTVLKKIDAHQQKMILMTAHRRENFGRPFENVFKAVARLARRYPAIHWVYPVHPNPQVKGPAERYLSSLVNIHLLDPLDYGDMVHVLKRSELVVTDSGGLQEEAPALGKPVLVLREVTERPEAVAAGTVRLVGTDATKLESQACRLLEDKTFYRRMSKAVNPYGDGHACERIAQAIRWYFGMTKKKPAAFGSRV